MTGDTTDQRDTNQNLTSLDTEDKEFLKVARKALEAPASTIPSGLGRSVPEKIGNYRIVSILGRGGMGIVFEAEQQNPRRAVALKVVRGDRFVDEHYVRLFDREAQTLARLRHPSVAAIYETGCTEDGQHFFAMELVRGESLTAYVERVKPSLEDRLHLFTQVCDAINYAHQRGVIHRDLKPSNILVDADGRPKVLDFGLAKITQSDVAVSSLVTEIGRIQGTVPFMSPEQARGNADEIDIRSDVYSLGVILYELITERLPVAVQRTGLPEAVRSICEDEPTKPGLINRSAKGDLETIILKALAKEPHRRYQSAAALGDDISRLLANQPILARPASTLYQIKKLVSRHKVAVSLGGVILALILGFGIWMSVLYARAASAEQRAAKEAATAQRTSDFLINLFDIADPDFAQGKELTAFDILNNGVQQINTDLQNEPIVRATLMITMGRVYRNLGMFDKALQLLKQSLQIRLDQYGEQNLESADGYFWLGWATRLKGDYREAKRLLTKALEIRRSLLGYDDPIVAKQMVILATADRDLGNFEQAEAGIREALLILEDAYGMMHDDVTSTLESLSEVLSDRGKFAEAVPPAEQALKIRREMKGPRHSYCASTLQALASAWRGMGELSKAETAARDSLSIYRDSHGENHHYTAAVRGLLSAILRDQGEPQAALPLAQADLATCRKRLPPDHPHIARAASNLAWVHYELGDLDKADSLFREARSIYRIRLERTHFSMADPTLGLALTCLDRGQYDEAQQLLEETIHVCDASHIDRHWLRSVAQNALAQCYAHRNRRDKAKELFLTSWQTLCELRSSKDHYVKAASKRAQDAYVQWGDEKGAERFATCSP